MEKLVFDKPDSVDAKVNLLKKAYATHKTQDLSFRMKQLKILKAALVKYGPEMDEANKLDLGQSPFFSFFGTTAGIMNETDHTIKNLESWAAPRYVDSPAAFAPATSYIHPEPHGVVLVMGAWNFQFALAINPLCIALAAGNVVLVKPSEMAPHSAKVVEKICLELDQDVVQFCHGAVETCVALLKNQFDLIFFTGSPQKGKLVAKAAAEFLTPCILELGGQNPCIVDKTCDIHNAAVNLCMGRFFNGGQICIGPEYIFVEESIKDKLVKELQKVVVDFYGDKPIESQDYSRCINEWHADRVSKLCQNHGGKTLCGGDFNVKEKYISPTIVEFDSIEAMKKSSLSKEEIFGPILYLTSYKDIDTPINYINGKDKPLAMYYFGSDKKNLNLLKNHTSSGAIVTNDTIIHYANADLPFGGVGASGYGSYHGKWGFDALSHLKPIMERPQMTMSLRYPPFKNNETIMRFMLKNATFTQGNVISFFKWCFVLTIAFFMREQILGFGNSMISKGNDAFFK